MTGATSAGDEDRLEQILEQWFERRHAGESPDLAALCAVAPELRPRVERLLERHAALLETSQGSAPSRGPLLVDRLGDYRLKARIGHGGMGEVFLARQESLGRLVALKVLRPDLAADPARRLRFRREAEITAALDHPNIVPVYETGEQDGYVFIAMKLLDGHTLDTRPAPWEPRQLASIGAQAARALYAAHEVGVVHRDVKPANILVADRPYVLDFGLARARVDLTLTGEGQAPGTLSFMAPEQLQGGPAALDPRVDVYALGATLYTCLAGRPPFEEDRAEVLMRRILVQEPDPIDGSAVGRDLVTIVLRALDKEPARRFATALEMAEDLERFVGGYPIRSRRCGLTTRTYRLVRRHRLVSAVMAVVLAVVAVLGALLWDSRRAAGAERARQIEVARTQLQGFRFADALATVRSVQEGHGDDPELKEMESRAVTTLLRDALLDQLQAGRRYQDVVHLRAMADDLEGRHTEVLAESHTALALLLLDFYELSGAKTPLDGLDDPRIINDFPRCRVALSAVLEGADPVVALAELQPSTHSEARIDDHVFASVVLRIAESSLDAIEGELVLAHDLDPEHVRYRFGHALVHGLRGDRARGEEVLIGLVQDGIPRPEVHVLLARFLARRGKFDSARDHLAEAAQELTLNARPALLRLDLAWLEVLLLQGAVEEFDERLEGARKQWGQSALLSVYEGYQAYQRGDVERARAAFAAAVANATLPWNERRAQQALLSLDVSLRQQQAKNEQDIGDAIPGLMERAKALAEACRRANEPTDESDALADLFQLQELKGATAQAWRTLRRAVGTEPAAERAMYLFLWRVGQRFCNRENDAYVDNPREVALATDALGCARSYYARSEADATFTQREKLAEVMTFATRLALFLADHKVAQWAGSRAKAAMGDSDRLEGFVAVLEECRAELGLDAWPALAR